MTAPLPRRQPQHAEIVFLREQIERYRPQFDTHGSLCMLAIDAQARGMFDLAQRYVASARRIDEEFFGGYFVRRTK